MGRRGWPGREEGGRDATAEEDGDETIDALGSIRAFGLGEDRGRGRTNKNWPKGGGGRNGTGKSGANKRKPVGHMGSNDLGRRQGQLRFKQVSKGVRPERTSALGAGDPRTAAQRRRWRCMTPAGPNRLPYQSPRRSPSPEVGGSRLRNFCATAEVAGGKAPAQQGGREKRNPRERQLESLCSGPSKAERPRSRGAAPQSSLHHCDGDVEVGVPDLLAAVRGPVVLQPSEPPHPCVPIMSAPGSPLGTSWPPSTRAARILCSSSLTTCLRWGRPFPHPPSPSAKRPTLPLGLLGLFRHAEQTPPFSLDRLLPCGDAAEGHRRAQAPRGGCCGQGRAAGGPTTSAQP